MSVVRLADYYYSSSWATRSVTPVHKLVAETGYGAYTRGDRRCNRSERPSRRGLLRRSPLQSPRVYTTGDRRCNDRSDSRRNNRPVYTPFLPLYHALDICTVRSGNMPTAELNSLNKLLKSPFFSAKLLTCTKVTYNGQLYTVHELSLQSLWTE